VPDPLINRRLGRYEIHQELGRGGMARVYRATDTLLQRPVALKILAPQMADDSDLARRFEREAVTAANLRHPAIVTIFDVGESEGLRYIAMEYIAGRTLQDVFDERGRLPLPLVAGVLQPVAEALQYAHAQGAVHRDVKPGNILIDVDGRVLLTDFGIAVGPKAGAERLTRAGTFMGTPEFLSPEQAQARQPDGRSDIYSLGIVGWEALTGRLPFEGATPQLLMAHVYATPPAITSLAPNLPRELDTIFARVLAKDPAARFDRATEFTEALRNAAYGINLPPAKPNHIAALAVPLGPSVGRATVALPVSRLPAEPQPAPAPEAFPIAEIFDTQPAASQVPIVDIFGPAPDASSAAPLPHPGPARAAARSGVNPAEAVSLERKRADLKPVGPRAGGSARQAGPPARPAFTPDDRGGPSRALALAVAALAALVVILLVLPWAGRLGVSNRDGRSNLEASFAGKAATAEPPSSTPAPAPADSTVAAGASAIVDQSASKQASTSTPPAPTPLGGDGIRVSVSDGALSLFDTNLNTGTSISSTAQSIGPAAIAPDGATVIFDALQNNERRLYKFDRASGGVMPFMPANEAQLHPLANGEQYHPAWSADGRALVFAGTQDGNLEIYRTDANGARIERLTNDQAEDDYPSFTPDGEQIVWESNRDGHWQIFGMTQDGMRRLVEPVPGRDDRYPRVSPDGAQLVFASNRDRADGKLEIYIQALPNGSPRRLTSFRSGTSSGPQWSSDGRQIVFWSNARANNNDLYIVPAAGGTPSALTFGPADERWPVLGR
jgi:serine/threonine-protein kinase